MLAMAIGILLLISALIGIACAIMMIRSNRRHADRLAAEIGLVRKDGESTRSLLMRVMARRRAWQTLRGPWR